MEYIENIINTIPDVIWAAVIASFLTFLGVMLTNRGNQNSLAMHLSHDKEKFIYEQEVSLKKEVFLESAAAFSQSLAAIPKLANLDISMEDINADLAGYVPTSAKLYLIANLETVTNAVNFSNELGEVFLSLVKSRTELDDMKEAISIYQEMMDDASAERKRLLTIIKELNLHGADDEKQREYLEKSYDAQTAHIEQDQKDIDNLRKKLSPKQIQFLQTCLSEYARLTILITPMISSVRTELHTSEEKEEFDLIFKSSMARMQKSFDNFIKDTVP